MIEIQHLLGSSAHEEPRPDEKQETLVSPFSLNVKKLPTVEESKIVDESEMDFQRGVSDVHAEQAPAKNELLATEESSVAYSIIMD